MSNCVLPLIGITGQPTESAILADRASELPFFGAPQSYVRAVYRAGAMPVVLPALFETERDWRSLLAGLAGLVASGGGDIDPQLYGQADSGLAGNVNPVRDRTELGLVRLALELDVPLLAICRGHQVLNVASGGTLIQDLPTQMPAAMAHHPAPGRPIFERTHTVDVRPGTRLAAVLGDGELLVNSAHHQAVGGLGEGLVVSARAPDGVVEGVELPDRRFCLSVQWHPEMMAGENPLMQRLFDALVEAARG